MATLYEYYNTGDDAFQDCWGVNWLAQTFTPATLHKITSVKLKLYRINSPGTITVSIRATDGSSHPTGADLCLGTTDGNTLPTSGGEWREVTLGSGCVLSANVKYAIVTRALDGDATNFFRWWLDGTSPTYAGGCLESSSNSGSSWSSTTSRDLMFEDWGDPITEKTSSETGSGAEALLNRAYILPEVGTGSESLGSRLLGAMEAGGGVETLLARLLTSTETATGLDAGGLFFTSGDAGSGLDAILALKALLTGDDSGLGIDTAYLVKILLSTDSGLGTEAVAALLAGIVAGELVVGSDCLVVKIESAPKGGGMKLPPGGKTSIPSRRVNL